MKQTQLIAAAVLWLAIYATGLFIMLIGRFIKEEEETIAMPIAAALSGFLYAVFFLLTTI